MEDQQKPTKKIALNYGIVLGFVSILLHVTLFSMGKHLEQDWKVMVLSLAITTVIIVLGIKKFKETNNGFLSLGQGLKTGIAIAMISSVVYIIYTLLFMNVIAPETMEQTLEIARQKLLENPNMSEDQIEQAMAIQRKFSGPAFLVPMMLIFSLFFGFIISIIVSLIMKKNEEDQY